MMISDWIEVVRAPDMSLPEISEERASHRGDQEAINDASAAEMRASLADGSLG